MRCGSRANRLNSSDCGTQRAMISKVESRQCGGSRTSSAPLMSSPCLFATCFSTKDVALNSLPQVLQRYFPSSSCLMCGSTSLANSLHKPKVNYGNNRGKTARLTRRGSCRRNPSGRQCLVAREVLSAPQASRRTAHLLTTTSPVSHPSACLWLTKRTGSIDYPVGQAFWQSTRIALALTVLIFRLGCL